MSGLPRWSYDDEIDAFYIRIADGAGQVQSVATDMAQIGAEGRLTRLEFWVGQ